MVGVALSEGWEWHCQRDDRPVYYYVFAVFTTLFYSKLRPTVEPDYSTLEQTSFFSKFVCAERDMP